MYGRILLPTDGTGPSTVAADHALGLAERYGATLHVVFVVDVGTSPLAVSKNEVRDALRDLGREAGQVVKEVERRAQDAGVDVSTTVLEGRVDDQILRYADDYDVDLVVMGTHGREGIERRLLGSVTEQVVRGADVPVLVVGEGAGVGEEDDAGR